VDTSAAEFGLKRRLVLLWCLLLPGILVSGPVSTLRAETEISTESEDIGGNTLLLRDACPQGRQRDRLAARDRMRLSASPSLPASSDGTPAATRSHPIGHRLSNGLCAPLRT
jgi:hypothetical protein